MATNSRSAATRAAKRRAPARVRSSKRVAPATRQARGRRQRLHHHRMRFKIAIHSGHKAPSHALDELLRGLGGRRGELTFLRRGSTIAVTCHEADGDSETRLV